MISLISVAASHRTCFCFKELYFFKSLLKVVTRFYVLLVVQFYIKILKKKYREFPHAPFPPSTVTPVVNILY